LQQVAVHCTVARLDAHDVIFHSSAAPHVALKFIAGVAYGGLPASSGDKSHNFGPFDSRGPYVVFLQIL